MECSLNFSHSSSNLPGWWLLRLPAEEEEEEDEAKEEEKEGASVLHSSANHTLLHSSQVYLQESARGLSSTASVSALGDEANQPHLPGPGGQSRGWGRGQSPAGGGRDHRGPPSPWRPSGPTGRGTVQEEEVRRARTSRASRTTGTSRTTSRTSRMGRTRRTTSRTTKTTRMTSRTIRTSRTGRTVVLLRSPDTFRIT